MTTQISSLELTHFPVMLSEIIKISNPKKGGVFIDCTFGGGNYTKALLDFPKTKVIGIDRDNSVISIARKLEKKFNNRFKFYHLKFSQIEKVCKDNVDCIIIDLGLSSIQLKDLRRGFSFKSKEKLDMTMGLSDKSAQQAINNLSLSILSNLMGSALFNSVIFAVTSLSVGFVSLLIHTSPL